MMMRRLRRHGIMRPERIIIALIGAATINLVTISAYPLMDARASMVFDDSSGRPTAFARTDGGADQQKMRLANDLPLPCRDGRASDGRPRSCRELLRWMYDEESRQHATDPGDRDRPCYDGRMSDGRPRTCDGLMKSLRRTM